jgi:sarcosine oxidase subunit alpha
MHFCHQVLWPELDVHFVSATDQWAQFSVAGPNSRKVLQTIVDPQFDIENDAFPYMAAGQVTVCGGVSARLYRISFSGELAYEIGVPARYGDAMARLLIVVGAPFGMVPYGTEALGVMRIEKGHVAGNELDGRTTARDLGLGRMMSTKKDYIGRVLADRPVLRSADRMCIAGFKPVDLAQRLRAGAHFVPIGGPHSATVDEGVMTSVAFSPSLGHWIGLGLIRRGSERIGERVVAADPVRENAVEVEICQPCFIDPKGERLRA